jgi:outer membrane receptor for ferrienterochelin and colicin
MRRGYMGMEVNIIDKRKTHHWSSLPLKLVLPDLERWKRTGNLECFGGGPLYTIHKGSIISMWFKNKIESHDVFSENFADHFHNILCFSDET